MPSLTQTIPNLEQVGPVIDISITQSQPYLKALKITQAKAIRVLAMIDTGATSTVIQRGIMQALEINPVGKAKINTPSSTGVECDQFDVQLVFPNSINIPSIIITEAPLQGQHIQCLIGRDILKHAVLIYTGYNNTYTLSF